MFTLVCRRIMASRGPILGHYLGRRALGPGLRVAKMPCRKRMMKLPSSYTAELHNLLQCCSCSPLP